jgi:hypothetical protein
VKSEDNFGNGTADAQVVSGFSISIVSNLKSGIVSGGWSPQLMKFNFEYLDTKRMSNEGNFANLAHGLSHIYAHEQFHVFPEEDKAIKKPVPAPVLIEPRPHPQVIQQVSESGL